MSRDLIRFDRKRRVPSDQAGCNRDHDKITTKREDLDVVIGSKTRSRTRTDRPGATGFPNGYVNSVGKIVDREAERS
jgi:hypothetical protein